MYVHTRNNLGYPVVASLRRQVKIMKNIKMNPKDKYHPKSIFSYINETPARQKHSLQNANVPATRRFGEKPQLNKRSETKLHTGNASQIIPPYKH